MRTVRLSLYFSLSCYLLLQRKWTESTLIVARSQRINILMYWTRCSC